MSGAPPNLATKPPEIDVEKLRAKIRAVFDLFDKDQKGTIVEEEVPTVMRALNCFPSDKDIVEIILPQMQEDEPTSFVTYERFEAKMLELLESEEYAPDTEDTLMAAFRAIDTERKGYVEAERLVELLTGDVGTPFRDKEVVSFLGAAKDPESGRIYYEDYIATMVTEMYS